MVSARVIGMGIGMGLISSSGTLTLLGERILRRKLAGEFFLGERFFGVPFLWRGATFGEPLATFGEPF